MFEIFGGNQGVYAQLIVTTNDEDLMILLIFTFFTLLNFTLLYFTLLYFYHVCIGYFVIFYNLQIS